MISSFQSSSGGILGARNHGNSTFLGKIEISVKIRVFIPLSMKIILVILFKPYDSCVLGDKMATYV